MNFLVILLIGLLGGVLGGLFGVGGGIVFVPLLVFLCHVNEHAAVGTSFAIIIPVVLTGLWMNQSSGTVHWRLAIPLGLCAAAGAWLGSKLSLQMDLVLLRRLFAILLLGVAVKMFLTK